MIEPGLKDALVEQGQLVDDMFSVSDFNISSKKDGVIKRPVIFCHDTQKMLLEVVEKRELEYEHLQFKIGIDGGGGFLKICQNIIRQQDDTPKKRRLYSDGIQGAAHADTSVHKLIILVIAPDVSEIYENISQIWKLVDLEPLNEYGDVKNYAISCWDFSHIHHSIPVHGAILKSKYPIMSHKF